MNRRDEIVTGVFVLLGTAVIVVGALWLSESRWGEEFRTVEAHFRDVGQLQEGSGVTMRGVRVGRVESIGLAAEGVAVRMRIRSEVDLPPDPVVLLHPLSLFGDWGASIEPGSEHPELAAQPVPREEGVLPGRSTSDFARLSEHAQQIASNLQTITDRVEVAFDEETARNLSRAVNNFQAASEELVAIMGRQRESFGAFADDMASAGRTLRGTAADLDSTVSRLERATAEGELEAIVDNTRQTTASLRQITGELEGTAADVRGTIARADSALVQAEMIFARINQGEGSLGRMARDPVLYEDLRATLTELRALLDDLKSNPGRYFKFSIF